MGSMEEHVVVRVKLVGSRGEHVGVLGEHGEHVVHSGEEKFDKMVTGSRQKKERQRLLGT